MRLRKSAGIVGNYKRRENKRCRLGDISAGIHSTTNEEGERSEIDAAAAFRRFEMQ